jgi:hypothetical protein
LQYAASLEEKASMAEGLKERFYRQEEENDETLGLATQEAAKVKHLVSWLFTSTIDYYPPPVCKTAGGIGMDGVRRVRRVRRRDL